MPVAVPLEKFGLINDAVSPAVRVFSDAPHEESEFSQTIPQRDVSPKQEFYFTGYRSELSLASADVEGVPQAETWMTGYTPVKLVGIGADYFIQWYDASRLRIREAMPIDEARITRGEYMMVKDGGDRDSHGVYLSRNGLTHLNPTEGGWGDQDGDDVPDGYTLSGGSAAYSAGEFSLTTNVGPVLRTTLPFPIQNATVTLSVEFTSLHSSGDHFIWLRTQDGSGTGIRGVLTNVTSTGRASVSMTLDENTHFLVVEPVNLTNVTASGTVTIKDPCLRVDGSDQYVPK